MGATNGAKNKGQEGDPFKVLLLYRAQVFLVIKRESPPLNILGPYPSHGTTPLSVGS